MTLRVQASHDISPPCHVWGLLVSSTSRDITYVLYRVTSNGLVIEESCDVMGRRGSKEVTNLSTLVAIVITVVEI